MKAIDMHCILLIISWFQYQRPQQERVRHQHWKDRLGSLLLMKMTVCWASATYFLFHSRQFAHRLAEEILSCSSAAMLVTLALSYLTIACHITYKALSHVYYFNILGGAVKLYAKMIVLKSHFTMKTFVSALKLHLFHIYSTLRLKTDMHARL